jgi:hypothetical protein
MWSELTASGMHWSVSAGARPVSFVVSRIGAVVQIVVLGAAAIVVWAAVIMIRQAVDPLRPFDAAAALILTLAVGIQRLSAIQRWLSSARDRRKEQITSLAQQALVEICSGRVVSQALMHFYVHVWAVPPWYRRLFPYGLRRFLKTRSDRRPVSFFTRWVIRPALERAAAVGLEKPATSGVRFYKGHGLIGVCIANSDPAELISLNVNSAAYKKALKAGTEEEWVAFGQAITHGISLEEATKLSHAYTQVIAKVVVDSQSGEPIGCVTASLREPLSVGYRLAQDQAARRAVTDLALSLRDVL